jgi:hypothetical protein
MSVRWLIISNTRMFINCVNNAKYEEVVFFETELVWLLRKTLTQLVMKTIRSISMSEWKFFLRWSTIMPCLLFKCFVITRLLCDYIIAHMNTNRALASSMYSLVRIWTQTPTVHCLQLHTQDCWLFPKYKKFTKYLVYLETFNCQC